MNSPLFITISKRLSKNWLDAFPEAELQVGLPERFDLYNDSIIFLDFSGLDESLKGQWLSAAVATSRKVVVLSLVPDNDEALTVIQHGAVGYGHSLTSGAQLRAMNLVVSNGGLWVGSKLMKRVLEALAHNSQNKASDLEQQPSADTNSWPGQQDILAKLTKREAMVALAVARGASNLEISTSLSIKERTVKAHISSTFTKLKVRNRVGLALLLNNIDISDTSMDIKSKEHAL